MTPRPCDATVKRLPPLGHAVPTDPLRLLANARSIAVVGASATPGKDAHEIPQYILQQGYELFPVNPNAKEIFGRAPFPTLADVPRPVDIVNVFRPSDETPAIAQQAVDTGARALWLQTGIAHADARRVAEDAGLAYVENTCIRVAHQRLQHMRQAGDR